MESSPLNPPYLFELDRSGFEDAVRGGIAAPHDIMLLYDFARRQAERITALQRQLESPGEKRRRVYYQDIVYSVCNHLDHALGTKIVCGTVDSPTAECQNSAKLAADLIEQQAAQIAELMNFALEQEQARFDDKRQVWRWTESGEAVGSEEAAASTQGESDA